MGALLRQPSIVPSIRAWTLLTLLQFVAANQCCATVKPLTVAIAVKLVMTKEKVVFRNLSVPIRYGYAL